MTERARLLCTLVVTAIIVATVSLGAVKFTSTWAAPDAASVSFKLQKVAALVITDDQPLRMSAEESLARELTGRGMQGVPAYRIIPREEMKDPEKAKSWLEREGIVGVVALRPVSQTKSQRYSADIWASPYYSSLWGYYPYGWTTVYVGGDIPVDTVLVVESLIYQTATGKLVWGGVSEATNPKSVQSLIGDIVKEAAKKIEAKFR